MCVSRMTVVCTGCGSVVNWMSSARAKTASEKVMASIPVYNFIVRIGTGGWDRTLIRRLFRAWSSSWMYERCRRCRRCRRSSILHSFLMGDPIDRETSHFIAIGQTKLFFDVCSMGFDGLNAETQIMSHRFRAMSFPQHSQNL